MFCFMLLKAETTAQLNINVLKWEPAHDGMGTSFCYLCLTRDNFVTSNTSYWLGS